MGSYKSIGGHLKKHGIQIDEYKKMFPLAPTVSLKTSKKMQDSAREDMKTNPERIKNFNKMVEDGFNIHNVPCQTHSKRKISLSNRKFFKIIKCKFCGKEVLPEENKYHIKHFCSRECYANYGYITSKCLICGELFNHKKSKKQIFCSYKCRGIWTSKEKLKKIPKISRICKYCGKEFFVIPYVISKDGKKHGHTGEYCSRKCYHKSRMNKLKK